MPVTTPQASRQAVVSGMSGLTGTAWIACTTMRSANDDVAAKLKQGCPSSVNGWLMLPIDLRQWVGRPVLHSAHMPHDASVATTTWSPGFTLVTAPPTASTTPAPSCPSTAGEPHGIVPSTTLTSEWHTPAATMRTSTSVGPGSRTSNPWVTSALSPV